MSSHDVVDPVEAVGGASRRSPVGASGPEGAQGSSSTQSQSNYLFQTNYVLEVMKYTNIAMQHQANIVAMRGEVAALATKISSDLATISEFISKIESEAKSGGQLTQEGEASPNSFSGLSPDFYHMSETDGSEFGRDTHEGCVSDSYKNMMAGFITAVKDLYYSSPTGVGPTVGDLTTINNPSDPSKNFDMLGYFTNIQSGYSKYSEGTDSLVVSTKLTDHPSLIQQYMYAKAKLTVNTATPQDLANAGGDISKLVDFDPTSEGFDSDLTPFMQVLDSLNVSTSVASDHSETCWTKPTTRNILSMILNGQLYTTPNTAPYEDAGLYLAFSYMGYNYIWTKNPNLDVADQTASNVTTSDQSWHYQSYKGIPQGDPLSALYANMTSCQANFSAAGNATGTSFQQDVNSVQQVDGAAGKIVDGFSQGQETLVRNFKGS